MSGALSTLSTSDCFLPYLASPRPTHKEYALRKLSKIVDSHWHEIAENLEILEDIASHEAETNLSQLSSLVMSKTFYFLGEYSESLRYALQSGNFFSLADVTDYESTIATKAIDLYIKSKDENESPSPILESFVTKIVENSISQSSSGEKSIESEICIIITAGMFDMFELLIKNVLTSAEYASNTPKMSALCEFTYHTIETHVQDPEARNKWFRLIMKNFKPPTHKIVSILIQNESIPDICEYLAKSDDVTALQFSLDLVANSDPYLLSCIIKDAAKNENYHIYENILSGDDSYSKLKTHFMATKSHADSKTMKQMKDASRNIVTNNAVSICNGLMNFGTSKDKFLRENLDWLAKFVCWPCYSASGTLGQIYQNNKDDSMEILSSYLPQESAQDPTTPINPALANTPTGNNFSEGGAFFALGMMNAAQDHPKVRDYLVDKLHTVSADQQEFVVHGICAGLGLSSALSWNMTIVEKLKGCLYTDQNMVGFSAAVAIGLVLAGRAGSPKVSEELNELFEYSKETKHEKIILGCALGQALIVTGKPNSFPLPKSNAESDQLSNFSAMIAHIDPFIRLAAVDSIATAYCGTNDPQAISVLLNLIAGDVSTSIQRHATIAIGFVMARKPILGLEILETLITHHNMHIRFGAYLALGISFASTGSSKALNILRNVSTESVSSVKQAMIIAMGMIINSQNKSTCSLYEQIRKLISSYSMTDSEGFMAKFGGIIAFGLENAGGQNVNISCFNQLGQVSPKKVAGLLIFSHYWFWHPFLQYIPLSFETTMLLMVNSKMEALDVNFIIDGDKESFAYSERFKASNFREIDTVRSAVLSFMKNKGRAGMGRKTTKNAPPTSSTATSHTVAGTSSSAAATNGQSSDNGTASTTSTSPAKKPKASKGNKSKRRSVEEFQAAADSAPEIATTKNGHAADLKSNGNDKPTVKIAEIVKLPVEIPKQTKPMALSSTNINEISQIPNFSRILPNNRSKIAKYQTSSKNVLPCRNLSLGGIVVCKTVGDEEKILFSLTQIASSATKKSDSGSLKDSPEKNDAAENSATKSSESTVKPPVSFEFNPDQLE